MAKDKSKDNGGLVFEKLGADFEIPTRVKESQYEPVLEQLKAAKGQWARIYKNAEAKPANTRRKSLLTAAEANSMDVEAKVRQELQADGKTTLNVLFARFIGMVKLAEAVK